MVFKDLCKQKEMVCIHLKQLYRGKAAMKRQVGARFYDFFTAHIFFKLFFFFYTIFIKSLVEFVTILLCSIFWFFSPEACEILPPLRGTEPTPPSIREQSFNHWTAREVT